MNKMLFYVFLTFIIGTEEPQLLLFCSNCGTAQSFYGSIAVDTPIPGYYWCFQRILVWHFTVCLQLGWVVPYHTVKFNWCTSHCLSVMIVVFHGGCDLVVATRLVIVSNELRLSLLMLDTQSLPFSMFQYYTFFRSATILKQGGGLNTGLQDSILCNSNYS